VTGANLGARYPARDAALSDLRRTDTNELEKTSDVMVYKAQSAPRVWVGDVFGHLGEEEMRAVSLSLAVFLSVV
jgi:hypothetical protein